MLKRNSGSRRIYDTERSCYVSIADIRSRLMQGEAVTDSKTGEDVTAAVLARLIMDEMKSANAPTAEALRRFILSYSAGKPARKVA